MDITAPGESVWRALSMKKNGTVEYSIEPSSGTSYAVAHVAGACATWLAFHGRTALIAKYGAAKLAGVFRTLLTTFGFNRPPGWDTGDYGPGIIDMAKLLGAPLPPAAKATTPQPVLCARSPQEEHGGSHRGLFPRSVQGASARRAR